MKTKWVLWLVGSAMLGACRQSVRTTCVEGALTGLESDTLLVTYFPVSDLNREEIRTDTIVAAQGKFVYSLERDSVPAELFFSVKPKDEDLPSLHKTVGVVAFPGETVRVAGSMDDYRVEGNSFHEAYRQVQELCRPYKSRLDEITEAVMTGQKEGTLTPEYIDSVRIVYEAVDEERQKVQEEYIRQHPDEDVSVYLLSDMSSAHIKELMGTIGEKARSGSMTSLYRALEDAMEKERVREEAAARVAEGKEAPDFTLKDIHGNDFVLSSLRGKYVVLDFWGSWCGWCIKGLPDMKKAYARYKDKMEIVGVDCRDTEAQWKEAVTKYQLPWIHVRNDHDGFDLTVAYAIQGYPTKIVVDRDGKIAKVAVGEDPAFYTYLESLFEK